MEFGLEPFILQKICDVLKQYPQVEKTVIYGSRATGNFKPSSDIDIAIHAPGMSRDMFGRLRFEIDELPIIFKMDIVHVESLRNEALKNKIVDEGKPIFPDELLNGKKDTVYSTSTHL